MHVIVGITGGIAAYKATGIIRLLTEAGHSVKVIPTQNALRFIGAATLEALSHNSVDPDLYTDVESVKHVQLGQEADLVIVAPASASFLARYAAGIADDLLGNTLLVTKAPVIVAPAMHTEMWQHAATKASVKTLEARGVKILQPETGRLTGEDSGVGRLPEAETIVNFALASMGDQDLAGMKFVVTAGGTREQIDPVRFLGNYSSGKQGIAVALEAQRRGATVTLVAANIDSVSTELINVIHVKSAKELSAALDSVYRTTDVLIMAAAVADFSISDSYETKIKKSKVGDTLSLQLVANEDILRGITSQVAQHNIELLTVGFAAETVSTDGELESLALKKLTDKNCDVILANNVSNGQVFGSDLNDALIFSATGPKVKASGTKSEVARELINVIVDLLKK